MNKRNALAFRTGILFILLVPSFFFFNIRAMAQPEGELAAKAVALERLSETDSGPGIKDRRGPLRYRENPLRKFSFGDIR